MKYPRYKITLEMTYDEYLGLLWHAEGMVGVYPDKQTIKKLKAYQGKLQKSEKLWKMKAMKFLQ